MLPPRSPGDGSEMSGSGPPPSLPGIPDKGSEDKVAEDVPLNASSSAKSTSSFGKVEILSQGENQRLWRIRVSHRERDVCRTSLFIFPLNSCLRQQIIWFVEWKWFDRFILACIVVNSLMLGFEQHRAYEAEDDWQYKMNWVFEKVGNRILLATFTLESILKTIAYGLIVDEKTYLRDPWNILDFIVVVSGLLEELMAAVGAQGLNVSFLRLFRLFRPLRSLNSVPQMKILVSTVFKSVVISANVLVLGLFLFMLFSIVGIQLMSGIFYHQCYVDPYPTLVSKDGSQCWEWILTGDDRLCGGNYMCGRTGDPPSDISTPIGYCGGHEDDVDYGPFRKGAVDKNGTAISKGDYPWCEGSEPSKPNPETDFVHFDHLGAAFLLIFQVMTLEGWTDLMYYVEDSSFSTVFAIIFFILVVLMNNFFMLNVFLAVVDEVQDGERSAEVDEETTLAEKIEEEAGVVANVIGEVVAGRIEQEEILPDGSMEEEGDLDKMEPCCENAFVTACQNIAESSLFQNFVMLIIALNVINMCMSFYSLGDPFGYSGLHFISFLLESTFLGIFIIEMFIMLVAYGFKGYLKNPVTAFDGFVVVISTTEWIILFVGDGGGGGALSVLRTFRLFRVMNKLANKWTQLKVLLLAMVKTGKALNYWLVLFMLVMYICTLMWIQTFATQMHFEDTDDLAKIEARDISDGDKWCAGWNNGPYKLDSGGHNVPNPKWTYRQDCIPRAHFDTFPWAFIAIFQIMTGENWNTIMYAGMRAAGEWEGSLLPGSVWAALLFILIIWFGQILFLSLFLSMLISTFDDVQDEVNRKETLKLEQSQKMKAKKSGDADNPESNRRSMKENIAHALVSLTSASNVRASGNQLPGQVSESENPEEDAPERGRSGSKERSDSDGENTAKDALVVSDATKWPTGYACFWLSESNPIRRAARWVLTKKIKFSEKAEGEGVLVFDNFILVCILISTICMMMDTPVSPPDAPLTKLVRTLDLVFAIIFIIEMTVKLFALGLFWGKDAYLHSPWNWLDGIVVMVSVVDIITKIVTGSGGPGFLRVLRILRTFRPLRVISRNEGLKVVVDTLFRSLSDLIGLVIVFMLVMMIFALIFMILLQGKLFMCSPGDDAVGYQRNLGNDWTTPLCLNKDFSDRWSAPNGSFDPQWTDTTKGVGTWLNGECSGGKQWQRPSSDTPICLARCEVSDDAKVTDLCRQRYTKPEQLPHNCGDDVDRSGLSFAAEEQIGINYIEDMQRTLVVPCGGYEVVGGKATLSAEEFSCQKNFCEEVTTVDESCKNECIGDSSDPWHRIPFCKDTCKSDSSSAACEVCRHECEAACMCEKYCTPLILDAALCHEQKGEWGQAVSQNFDNFWNAMLTLFEISTTEGWVDVMYAAADMVGDFKQPERDVNLFPLIFFLFPIWIFVSFMFLINLAVGIIVDTFMDLKKSGSKAVVPPPVASIEFDDHTAYDDCFTIQCKNPEEFNYGNYDSLGVFLDGTRKETLTVKKGMANRKKVKGAQLGRNIEIRFYAPVEASSEEEQQEDYKWTLSFKLNAAMVGQTYFAGQNLPSEGLMLTEAQQKWLKSRNDLASRQRFFDLENLDNLSKNRFTLYTFVASPAFENFIMGCIIANTVVLGSKIYPDPFDGTWGDILQIIGYIFAAIFTVEAILKIAALHGSYWKNNWNIFDFACVSASLLGIFLKIAFEIEIGPVTSVIRILRITRLLKFFKELNRLFMCLFISIPKLFNVTLVWSLFLILFSILGMSVFGNAKLNETLNIHGNFQTFLRAFVTLFRASTGEAWNEIMHDLAKDEVDWFRAGDWCTPISLFKSDDVDTFNILKSKCLIEDPDNGNIGRPNACSGAWMFLPALYWCLYTLIITYMIVNLVVAVILEGYEEGKENEDADNIDVCIKNWRKKDPNHRYQIPLADALDFMNEVIQELNEKRAEENKKAIEIPTLRGSTIVEVADNIEYKKLKFVFSDFTVHYKTDDPEQKNPEVTFVDATSNVIKLIALGSLSGKEADERLNEINQTEKLLSPKEQAKFNSKLKQGGTKSMDPSELKTSDMKENLAATRLQRGFKKQLSKKASTDENPGALSSDNETPVKQIGKATDQDEEALRSAGEAVNTPQQPRENAAVDPAG